MRQMTRSIVVDELATVEILEDLALSIHGILPRCYLCADVAGSELACLHVQEGKGPAFENKEHVCLTFVPAVDVEEDVELVLSDQRIIR